MWDVVFEKSSINRQNLRNFDDMGLYYISETELEPYNFVLFRISIRFRRKNVNENKRISPLNASKQVTSQRVIK